MARWNWTFNWKGWRHQPDLRFFAWAAIGCLLFGAVQLGDLPNSTLRTIRNSIHSHRASGDIVLVKIDDKSLADVGDWPWPRRHYAGMVDQLTRMNARQIVIRTSMAFRTSAQDDAALARSIARSGRVVLPVWPADGQTLDASVQNAPLPGFSRNSRLASASVRYNYQNVVWSVPYNQVAGNRSYPSIATVLAEKSTGKRTEFPIDYSADPDSIPSISASDVLAGRVPAAAIAGKSIVISATVTQAGDQLFIPGADRRAPAYVHILAAETLKTGTPRSIGWLLPLVLTLALLGAGMAQKNGVRQNSIFAATAALLLVGPIVLDTHLWFVNVGASLLATGLFAWRFNWRRMRERGEVNPLSGLPNLVAFRKDKQADQSVLVAARVNNFVSIASALAPAFQRQLIEQIVSRLTVDRPSRIIYQGDEGVFAWFMDIDAPVAHHVEALYALFRNAARVGDLQLDLSISFGIESGTGRSVENRLASALVVADEALTEGLKWKHFDPERLSNASWKLSLLGSLDQAIEKGQIWVAYQPKLDLRTGRIAGAEALARWTHPERGQISPVEFIAHAEQSDRIESLTFYILDQAIAAAASINAQGVDFSVAVNLSARLPANRSLPKKVSELLARHQLPTSKLTLELTETIAMKGGSAALDVLGELRDMGVNISIDDYGTGQSTLDYLKKVPASELKIDQSFIRSICTNRSDRLMVQSTIVLAHALDRKVVAEGVEDQEIIDLLRAMDCDIVQGYAIGRPTNLETLAKRVLTDKSRSVA